MELMNCLSLNSIPQERRSSTSFLAFQKFKLSMASLIRVAKNPSCWKSSNGE